MLAGTVGYQPPPVLYGIFLIASSAPDAGKPLIIHCALQTNKMQLNYHTFYMKYYLKSSKTRIVLAINVQLPISVWFIYEHLSMSWSLQ